MKVNLKIIENGERVATTFLMEIIMRVNLEIIKCMVRVFSIISNKDLVIMENGSLT